MIDPQLSDAPLDVSPRTLREFAALWLVFCLGLAAWQWFARGHATAAWVLAGLAALVGVGGMLSPAAIRPLFQGLMFVTFPIGWIVSHLIIGLLFWGLITPIGIVFRLLRRDVLVRRRPRDQVTYWLVKPQPTDLRSYFHQY